MSLHFWTFADLWGPICDVINRVSSTKFYIRTLKHIFDSNNNHLKYSLFKKKKNLLCIFQLKHIMSLTSTVAPLRFLLLSVQKTILSVCQCMKNHVQKACFLNEVQWNHSYPDAFVTNSNRPNRWCIRMSKMCFFFSCKSRGTYCIWLYSWVEIKPNYLYWIITKNIKLWII